MTFKKFNQLSFISIIGIIVLGIFVNNIFKVLPDKISTEKRELAICKDIQKSKEESYKDYLKNIQSFPSAFEKCFNDQFSLRNALVSFSNLTKITMFNEIQGRSIYKSDNNFFFYTDSYVLEASQGNIKYTNEDRNNILSSYQKRKSFADENGFKYISLITPNKNTVYPEYLRSPFNKISYPTKLDGYGEIIAPSQVPYYNLKNDLLNLKKSKNVFYPNDSHWNYDGISIAYNQIAKMINTDDKQIIKPITEFNSITVDHKGDIPFVLSIFDNYVNKGVTKLVYPNTKTFVDQSAPKSVELTSGKKVEYQKILNSDKTLPKLVVLGDSFTDELRPLLAESFSEVQLIKSYEEFPYAQIKEIKPDFVISLFNETQLHAKID